MLNRAKSNNLELDTYQYHLRALEEAVSQGNDHELRHSKVIDALNYLQNKSNRNWGFTLFRQGLEIRSNAALHDGLRLIKQHMG